MCVWAACVRVCFLTEVQAATRERRPVCREHVLRRRWVLEGQRKEKPQVYIIKMKSIKTNQREKFLGNLAHEGPEFHFPLPPPVHLSPYLVLQMKLSHLSN